MTTSEEQIRNLELQVTARQREEMAQEASYKLTLQNVEAAVSALKEHYGVSTLEEAHKLYDQKVLELNGALAEIEELLNGKV